MIGTAASGTLRALRTSALVARCGLLTAMFLSLVACGGAVPDAGRDAARAEEDAGDDAGPHDAGLPSDAVILSAYHGLDMLPARANFLCGGTDVEGDDGMPLVFSVQLTMASVTADAFRVETADGSPVTPTCATLAPAVEARERRTVLLAGPFGTPDAPPRAVEVVGDLRDADGRSLTGLRIESIVTLAEGASLALVERFEPGTAGFEGECPAGAQILQLTWEGGVSGPGGAPLGDAQRTGIEVTVQGEEVVIPAALGDDDPDNHVVACVNDWRPATSVSVTAGLFHDPGDDANPATDAEVMAGVL